MKRLILITMTMLGCPGDADDGDTAADSGSGGETCDPGIIEECTCTDGSMSTQTCNPEGTGFSACECGGTTSSSGSATGSTSASTSTTNGSGATDEGSTGAADDSTGAADEGSSESGPPPNCMGSHPLVDGDLRYCDRGHCYCGDLEAMPAVDVCYAMEIAEACCPEGIELVCY